MDPFLFWFLLPLSGVLGTLFWFWLVENDADEDPTAGIAMISFFATLFVFGYSYYLFGWPMVLMHLAMAAAVSLPILATWLMRTYQVESRVKGWFGNIWQGIESRFVAWRKRRRERPGAIVEQAEKRVRQLVAIIPDSPWTETCESIQRVAYEHLPNLLTQRDVLNRQIERVGQIIASYQNKSLDEYAKKLLDKTVADKQALEQMLADNERQIKAARSFLDHIESDLYVAVNEGAGSASHQQVTDKLDELGSGIQETAKRLQSSHEEVEETLGQVVPLKK